MIIPTFPNFGPLTLEDKEDYERLVAEYPPFSDISFSTLHIWWNLEGGLSLSALNGNLVINYYLAGDEKNSGYCLVGKSRLEESIQIIFEELRRAGQSVKLVHVPEFVTDRLKSREGLCIEEELDYNEYILDSQALAKLEGAIHGKNRRRINRFLREVESKSVTLKELDLSAPGDHSALLQVVREWEDAQKSTNDPKRTERQAMEKTLKYATKMGTQAIGLYVDDKLHGVVLYHQSHDKQYYIINHLKVDYSIRYIFDYMTHHIANKAVHENVKFLNMEMDLGIESLREHKMGLRPVDFFRKYTITLARP